MKNVTNNLALSMTIRPALFISAVMLASATACTPTSDDDAGGSGAGGGKADDPNGSELRFLDQGWSDEDRAWMYRTSEGSRIVPTQWLAALRDQRGTRFTSTLSQYGFIPDPASDPSGLGLPVGFATDGGWTGVTCTACHSSQLKVGSVAVRIDGGTMQADFGRFQLGLLREMKATFDDPRRFGDFAREVLGDNLEEFAEDELSADVRVWLEEMEFRLSFANGAPVPGPGRVDGVGQATNETLCIDLNDPGACDTFNAPTQPGFLWGVGELAWVQSNGSVHSSIGRNVGQAMGTYGGAAVGEDLFGFGGVSTNIPMEDLVYLDEGFTALKAPSWQDPAFEDLLPRLDDTRVSRGRQIYQATCAGCHASRTDGPFTATNQYDRRFVEVPVVPLAEIGTDPGFVVDLLDETVLPHPDIVAGLTSKFEEKFGSTDLDTPVSTAALRALLIVAAIQDYAVSNPLTVASLGLSRFSGYRDGATERSVTEVRGYRAQPLEGVAFTGPYLHNGSVPSLAALLRPSSQRPAEFLTGGRTFDPVAVGFTTKSDDVNAYQFDTRKPGNSNRGHEGPRYGTDLPDADKQALLEYLRSL